MMRKKAREVLLTKEPVPLYKILKFEQLVMSGGEAKQVIAQGLVTVNQSIETRKARKIVAGDTIVFQDIVLNIISTDDR